MVTQRDSLYVLDGLIANQTGIRPEMVSTDTADASEVTFALTRALGYRWAPRLADLPDLRLWRIAHYGPLDGGLRPSGRPLETKAGIASGVCGRRGTLGPGWLAPQPAS